MKIILASANKGKIKEIQSYYKECEVIPYSDLFGKFDIVEDGDSFLANATLKVRAIEEKLDSLEDIMILADDSGISVPFFGGEPGIYSARYAGNGASDKENMQKLIDKLQEHNLQKTPAFYTACIVALDKNGLKSVHGWMHGDVVNKACGDGGFGYDPIFVPDGYDKTLGELDPNVKKTISHRTQALDLIKRLID